MPPDSDTVQAKKARKKARPPQQIDEATWLAIEKAVVAGMGFLKLVGLSTSTSIQLSCARDATIGQSQAGSKSAPACYKLRYKGSRRPPRNAEIATIKRLKPPLKAGLNVAKCIAPSFMA